MFQLSRLLVCRDSVKNRTPEKNPNQKIHIKKTFSTIKSKNNSLIKIDPISKNNSLVNTHFKNKSESLLCNSQSEFTKIHSCSNDADHTKDIGVSALKAFILNSQNKDCSNKNHHENFSDSIEESNNNGLSEKDLTQEFINETFSPIRSKTKSMLESKTLIKAKQRKLTKNEYDTLYNNLIGNYRWKW